MEEASVLHGMYDGWGVRDGTKLLQGVEGQVGIPEGRGQRG